MSAVEFTTREGAIEFATRTRDRLRRVTGVARGLRLELSEPCRNGFRLVSLQ